MSEVSEREFRRNFALLAIENVSFSLGLTFFGATTVLPNLVRQLGGGPVAVGSVSTIQMAAWMLPQLFAGRYVANRRWVKNYVLWPAIIARAFLGLMVLALAFFGARAPRVALLALLSTLAAFWVADASGGAGWFDLLAKMVPLERRGRAMGVAQSLSSLAAIGAGIVIRGILARPAPFPENYVWLIGLGAGLISLSPLAIHLMREPVGVVQDAATPPWREYLPKLVGILRRDRRFAWLTLVGWVATLAEMGSAFYVLYASDRLHIPQPTIGLFISAGVVGGLLSGLVLGPLGDHRGSASVIVVTMVLRCLGPALALLAPAVAGWHPGLAPALFVLIFAGMGIINGAYMIGSMNYLLEIAPARERPLYVALSNTLGIVVVCAPLLAGWLVQATSYETLFAITLGLAFLGLAAALRQPGAATLPQAPETIG